MPENRKKTIVGPHETSAVRTHHDGVTRPAYARINYGEEYGIARIVMRERSKQVRGRLDGEGARVVQRVHQPGAGRALGEHCLDLPYVEIARTEIGEESDQAALAVFFSVFFSVLLPSETSSAPPSTRSIRVTSAIGALSPLRNPLFRMRR